MFNRYDTAPRFWRKESWWSARDRWIPPQRLRWSRPLLLRFRELRERGFGQVSWRRTTW